MRLIFYCFAAVALAGLAAALPFSRAQVVEPAKRERIVFVDLDRLARTHPCWRAAEEMEATLAEVGVTSSEVSLHLETPRMSLSLAGTDGGARVERSELEEEAARSVMEALQATESEMRRALWLKSRATREAMMANAESELAPQIREIDASAAAMVRALREHYAPDRLNAQLKAAALKVSAGSPAVDRGAAELKLHRAQEELDRVDQACASDEQRVINVAQARIDCLREAEAVKVEAWIEAYEKAEVGRIASELAPARERICSELRSRAEPVRSIAWGGLRDGTAGGVGPEPGRTASGGELRTAASHLRAKIQVETLRALRGLAREKRVTIVFENAATRVPDRTQDFIAAMRERGWSASGPVLAEARG